MNRFTIAAALAACTGTALATPDVICGTLDGINNYGQIGSLRAYSVGTTGCNIGTSNANWISNSPNHPVIGVTFWKYDHETARLTQIGVSHLKHSFAALQGNVCQPCQGGGNSSALGPGCSDPYGPGLNGSQGRLGPRSEVNAYTGDFVYPFTGQNVTGNNIYKRIKVEQSVITDSTANFYVEGVYTLVDDYEAGTNFNNASYRAININQSSFNASGTGQTFAEIPCIYAWQAHDAGVVINEAEYPGEGRMIVASKATDLGNGMWRYDYGVYNQNSDMAASSFTVPMNTSASGMGFNDVTYRDIVDENVSSIDWAPVEGASGITWNTETHSGANPWGNAIRWGTMYNFWFETDAAPTMGDTTIGSFKGGETLVIEGIVPTAAADCIADLNGDGETDFLDISDFLKGYTAEDPAVDFNDDGEWDFLDISDFLTAYSAGCP